MPDSSLRTCLLPPLPEHEAAADLLSSAADALIAGDVDLARQCLREADLPVLLEFARRLMGPMDPQIHRLRQVTRAATAVTKASVRMPTATQTTALYQRDGWRCRFCGCRVVSGRARSLLRAALPDALPWGTAEGYHGAFYALTASVDHVVPHSAGGGNDLENLVTACWGCQFGRGAYTLEEFGLSDPRLRSPFVDGWDGLTRVLAGAAAVIAGTETADRAPFVVAAEGDTAAAAPARPAPLRIFSARQTAWLAALDAIEPTPSRRLIDVLDGCADLGVSWSLNKVLLARMTVGGSTIEFMGVDPDGTTHLPWQLIDAKDAFRGFAETLASAIPGAVSYETAKWWKVARSDKEPLSLLEVLGTTGALRAALENLHAAMQPAA